MLMGHFGPGLATRLVQLKYAYKPNKMAHIGLITFFFWVGEGLLSYYILLWCYTKKYMTQISQKKKKYMTQIFSLHNKNSINNTKFMLK